MNLLFVCTGNTCRSPAAEVLARAEADRRGLGGIHTASAGTFAFAGQPAAGVSIAVAGARGLDLSGHRSAELSLELVEWADRTFAMTASHARGIEEIVPGTTVSLLTSALPEGHPRRGRGIADPVGGDREVYEETYRELEEAIFALFDRLGPEATGESAEAADGT
ncbi:MAG: low molecular weight protein arginine phosphatase [Gemmatimonadota bacterium]